MFDDVFEEMKGSTRPNIEPKPWMKQCQLVCVRAEDLPAVVDRCIESKLYALDLETTGLNSTVFDGRTKDFIVGFCLSPDGVSGYYVPVHHPDYPDLCVPQEYAYSEMRRLVRSGAVAIFHNARFDQEFLQFCGGEPIGEWDDPKGWEDTMLLAYLRNSRAQQKGLKFLSQTELGMEMIELDELFHPDEVKEHGKNFSKLNPAWESTILYAASDAICTYLLYQKLRGEALDPKTFSFGEGSNKFDFRVPSQNTVYTIEKMAIPAIRWMCRIGLPVDREKILELIRLGQREWLPAFLQVYVETSKALGRDVTPGFVKILTDPSSKYKFDAEDVSGGITHYIKLAKAESDRLRLDPVHVNGKKELEVDTFSKSVPKIGASGSETVEFPLVYDINIPEQLGLMLRELGVKGLVLTAKSGQVKTAKDMLDQVLADAGDDFPYIKKIKRFREIGKALSSNLFPLLEASDRKRSHNSRIRVNFDPYGTDTGRFSTPKPKLKFWIGYVQWNFQSIPKHESTDDKRPACMGRIREVIRAEDGYFIVAVDFSGQELRVVTNLSGEPLWVNEFFRCGDCGKTFDRKDDAGNTASPPPFCPQCGSDKIGDIHSLTAISIHGPEIREDEKTFKRYRNEAKCLHRDTLITTYPGNVRRIGGLPVSNRVGLFTKVEGEEVWGSDGWVRVLETYNPGPKTMHHVVTTRGVITCSDEHRLQLADGSMASIETGLGVGAALFFAPPPPLRHVVIDAKADRAAYMLGRSTLTSDGVVAGRHRFPEDILSDGEPAIKAYLYGLMGVEDGSGEVMISDLIFAGQVAACCAVVGITPSVIFDNFTGNVIISPARDEVRRVASVLAVVPYGERPSFDLHLDSDDHLFWANGFASHNSVNFALCYGGGGNAVVLASHVSIEEGWRIKRKFDETYTTLSTWWGAIQNYGRATGLVITAYGRRYPVPDIQIKPTNDMEKKAKAKAERNAVNGPVQGTGSDIMKFSMGLLYTEIKKRGWVDLVRMIATIHDEIVFEIHESVLSEAIEVIQEIMLQKTTRKLKWHVPLTCDTEIGRDWSVPYNYTHMVYGNKKIPPELACLQSKVKTKSHDVVDPGEPQPCVLPYKGETIDDVIRTVSTTKVFSNTGDNPLFATLSDGALSSLGTSVDGPKALIYYKTVTRDQAVMDYVSRSENPIKHPKCLPGDVIRIVVQETTMHTLITVFGTLRKCMGRGGCGLVVSSKDGKILLEEPDADVDPEDVYAYLSDVMVRP